MNPAARQLQRNLRAYFTHLLVALHVPYTVENLTRALDGYLEVEQDDPYVASCFLATLPESTFPPTPLTPPTNLKPEKN
jgi:hypothetical protein